MFNKYLYCIFLIFVIRSTISHPSAKTEHEEINKPHKNCAGEATRAVALSILKNNIDSDKNMVFSPFGFSTILTFLSEGARGETYKEIYEFLRHSSDIDQVRKDYNGALKYMQGNMPLEAPQFKSWFYIYANNTVENEFKQIIADNYFVEVKGISRDYYDWNEPKTSVEIEEPIDINVQEMPSEESTSLLLPVPSTVDLDESNTNSKDIVGFEDLKSEKFDDNEETEKQITEIKKSNIKNIEKEVSKFDHNVTDKQYVETPVIKQQKNDNTQENNIEENETVHIEEKNEENLKEIDLNRKKIMYEDEPVKISLPLKKLEDSLEIMQAVESHPLHKRFYRYGKSLFEKGDVASALSGNSLIGEVELTSINASNNELASNKKYESKMLLFNGLYFRGSWRIPFQQLRSDPEDVFHISLTDNVPITMMRSRGTYKVANLENINGQAIELPYENNRYSMLIIQPKNKDGLKDIIKNFEHETIKEIEQQLKPELINLSVPKFRLESTNRAEQSLSKSGLTKIFTINADLSGITKEQNIHLDELVQHVTLKVDEGASSENFLSATIAQRNLDESFVNDNMFIINKPFLYFIRDIESDVIIVAGTFINPPEFNESEEP